MIKPFFLATNRRLACCSLSSLPWVMYPSSVAMIPCCRVGTFHKISQSLNNYSLLRSKSHRRGIYIIMLFKGPHFKLGSWAVLFLGLQRIEIAACFWLPRLARFFGRSRHFDHCVLAAQSYVKSLFKEEPGWLRRWLSRFHTCPQAWWPVSDPWDPCKDAKRKATPTACPLPSTCVLWSMCQQSYPAHLNHTQHW